mmetsp:Transcript_104318/g.319355  ORF Transcript_104318/g.319355 Transcript_104318/m.319355 type:complete len:330 (-) Transcript_104318:124-1113(-)
MIKNDSNLDGNPSKNGVATITSLRQYNLTSAKRCTDTPLNNISLEVSSAWWKAKYEWYRLIRERKSCGRFSASHAADTMAILLAYCVFMLENLALISTMVAKMRPEATALAGPNKQERTSWRSESGSGPPHVVSMKTPSLSARTYETQSWSKASSANRTARSRARSSAVPWSDQPFQWAHSLPNSSGDDSLPQNHKHAKKCAMRKIARKTLDSAPPKDSLPRQMSLMAGRPSCQHFARRSSASIWSGRARLPVSTAGTYNMGAAAKDTRSIQKPCECKTAEEIASCSRISRRSWGQMKLVRIRKGTASKKNKPVKSTSTMATCHWASTS